MTVKPGASEVFPCAPCGKQAAAGHRDGGTRSCFPLTLPRLCPWNQIENLPSLWRRSNVFCRAKNTKGVPGDLDVALPNGFLTCRQ